MTLSLKQGLDESTFCFLNSAFYFGNESFLMVARHFIISGAVQGVGYRFFAMRAAARHQVFGTVRNLPDGNVEILAEGDREAMDQFKNDLAAGPMMAEVLNIEETDLPVTGRYRDFRIDH